MARRMIVAAGCEHVNDTLLVRDPEDEENFFDTTALLHASANGHTEVVQLLIETEADVNKCNQVDIL